MHNQAFHQIYGRIERFPKKLGVVCHGCVSHQHSPPPSLLASILLKKYGAAHPSWFLFNCALPKLYKLPDSWICGRLRVFAGVLRIFAGVLRVILGAVMCIYMRWCSGYENGLVCPWDAARMQAMFSQSYSKCHLW